MNAPRDQRTRLATSVVNLATFPGTAPTPLPRELDVVVEDSLLVAAELKSATSARRSVTSHVTALRLADTVVVGMAVVNRADMEVDSVAAVDVKVDRLATRVVVTATCRVTVPRAKSATTAAKLVISPETAHQRPPLSELATSASNLATSKPNAPTKQILR